MNRDQPAVYQIRLQGQLEARWLRRFEGLEVLTTTDGETVISGLMDQAALHGVLTSILDVGSALISVQRRQLSDDIAK